mgnify:CR=1 FL=1
MAAEKEKIVAPGQLYEIQPDGRWAFFFDHHLISTFSTCGMKFNYSHVKRIRRKGMGGFSLMVGAWWSDVMSDIYEAMKSNTLSEDLAHESAEHHWKKYLMDKYAIIQPIQYSNFGGRDGAINMTMEYYNQQVPVDRTIWKIVATEAGFGRRREVFLGESNKVLVFLIGKPDLAVIEMGRLGPVDHKTIDRVNSLTQSEYKPHPQMVGYCIGLEKIAKSLGLDMKVNRCIVNICARSPLPKVNRLGKKKTRFTRVYPSYTPEEIQEFQIQKVAQAEELRRSIESNLWIMKDSSCHLFDGCSYRKVCAVSPSSRQTIIDSSYEKKEPWVPYEI